ncbi:hypothetical protein TEK04_04650 [Klenkia sp. LSe6-5]|uniref:Cell division protein FtsL n=1 Tax=Klenkia sesuvii TaxID=3103137 RepID=A0ABU8DQR4_9ACTN
MSATARVHTGPLRGRGGAAARTATRGAARTATRGAPRGAAVRRTGPVHVRPQLRLVTAPVGTPTRARRVVGARPRRAPFVVLLVGLIAATALGLLALNTAIAVDSLRASQQRAANTELSRQVDRLEQQVTQQRTPEQLAADAAAAGLVPAGTVGHLVLGPDGTSVVRGTPAPAAAPEPDPAAEPAPAAAPAPTAEQPAAEQPGTDPTTPTAGG